MLTSCDIYMTATRRRYGSRPLPVGSDRSLWQIPASPNSPGLRRGGGGGMDEALYDEFGNYIGPELSDDSDSSAGDHSEGSDNEQDAREY